MMFCGYDFCSGITSMDMTSTNVNNITNVKLTNSIFEDLFLTKSITEPYELIMPENMVWDFNTVMHSAFKGNLFAGNVDFGLEVEMIRIKRRKVGTYTWVTLYEIPINELVDFKFERIEKFARSHTDYEFVLVPVTNGIEGNLNINTIRSEFNGVFVCGKEQIFGAMLEAKITNITKNRPYSTQTTMGNKYPFTISNGKANYYSGTAQGLFAQFNDATCTWDFENGWKFREGFMDFLNDGQPKILKFEDGRMWMIMVSDSPSEDNSEHEYKAITTFSWNETGDCESTQDLYDNGLSDLLTESW